MRMNNSWDRRGGQGTDGYGEECGGRGVKRFESVETTFKTVLPYCVLILKGDSGIAKPTR